MFSDFTSLLHLKNIKIDTYQGQTVDLGTRSVFGGLVLSQALKSAQMTVDSYRWVHSIHAYFLRAGDTTKPIEYEVERNRDGKSFSSRRVTALQQGQPICTLSASFHKAETGLNFQKKYSLPARTGALSAFKVENMPTDSDKNPTSYFDLQLVPQEERTEEYSTQWWLKTRRPLPDDIHTHHAVLTYISDYGLLGSLLQPHGYITGEENTDKKRVIAASIDHALWFHRPFRADQWLLYSTVPKSTFGARGVASGALYNQRGELIASSMQEILIRQIDG